MKKYEKVRSFLGEKHKELHDAVVKGSGYNLSAPDQKVFSYNLGQLDMVTQLCNMMDVECDIVDKYEK